jgi:lipopolysaccharide export system protein LptC
VNSPWLTAVGTALLGALTFWIWRQLDDDQLSEAARARHEPDYYLVEMIRQTMNREGGLQNVLTAEQVFHYPDNDTTELAHPHMEIYNGDANPWQVVAERGLVKADNEVIFLQGRVEIWRVDSNGEREFEILTSELRVFPKVQYAETDNAATIKGHSTVTKTRGFRANFEHNRLELLERVRTRHEKPPSA